MNGADRQYATHSAGDVPAPVAGNPARPQASQVVFAIVMMGLGVIGFVYRDFAMGWQRIPIDHLAGRMFFVYLSAFIELVCGLGLLIPRASRIASSILFVFLLIWAVLLKLPAVVMVPKMEATWLGFGEIAVILAGGWIFFAVHAGDWARSHLKFAVGASGIRIARILFAVSLPMIGLSHFFYTPQTVVLVPAWLPERVAWAYLTGAGNILAGLAVLLAIFPRLAAAMEAAMLAIITLLVWGPGLLRRYPPTGCM